MDTVEGNWNDQGRWYTAVVEGVFADGTINLKYVDGDKETRVLGKFVKRRGAPALASAPTPRKRQKLAEKKEEAPERGWLGRWSPF